MGSDAVDNAVMGENSRYQQRLQAAMEQGGLSREDAEKQLLLEDIRSAGSISPFVSGLMLHGADWGMRMLGDMDVISEAQRMAEEQNPKPYTDQDMEIARIMQDEAGSNPLGEKNDISIEDAAAKMAGVDSSDSAVVNSHGQDYTGDAIAPSENIERLIGESVPGRKTHGKSTQFEKQGGMEQAFEDFNSFNPTDVRVSNNTTIGTLSDGRIINVRPDSSEGSITLEIYNPTNSKKLKFRYKE